MKIKKIIKYLDPFYYLEIFLEKTIGEPNTKLKNAVHLLAHILYSFLLAYLIYLILSLILGVSMPLAIVVSSSMEPNMHVGDLVILSKPTNLKVETIDVNENIANKDLKEFLKLNFANNEYGLKEIESITISDKTFYIEDAKNNDVVVYTSNTRNKDIIHRAILKIKAQDGVYFISKGDNSKTNTLLDQDCDIERKEDQIILKNQCLNIYPTPINSIKGKLVTRIPYIGYIKIMLTKIINLF